MFHAKQSIHIYKLIVNKEKNCQANRHRDAIISKCSLNSTGM